MNNLEKFREAMEKENIDYFGKPSGIPGRTNSDSKFDLLIISGIALQGGPHLQLVTSRRKIHVDDRRLHSKRHPFRIMFQKPIFEKYRIGFGKIVTSNLDRNIGLIVFKSNLRRIGKTLFQNTI